MAGTEDNSRAKGGADLDAASADPEAVVLPEELAHLLDPGLEIPVDIQQRVLLLEGRLDAPYHEVLGVPEDAERSHLKKAYFKLSKDFHPDRYFRRNLGHFEARIDRVYKKIVEAYELLSDPTARAEIERSLAAAAGQAPSPPPKPDSRERGDAKARPDAVDPTALPKKRRVPLRPRSHGFSIQQRALKQRKAKAKRLFEAGMAAFAAERFVEASGSVRLAIAFDPWNQAFKDSFVDVQRKAHAVMAERHLKEAESALEMRDHVAAMKAFEELLHFRSHDPKTLTRAAQFALQAGSDLRQAKEWAQAAVDIDPDVAEYRLLLGQVFHAAGFEANARREFEMAIKLNPADEVAQEELRAMRGGRFSATRWFGGKR